jgi:hypothetical protein
MTAAGVAVESRDGWDGAERVDVVTEDHQGARMDSSCVWLPIRSSPKALQTVLRPPRLQIADWQHNFSVSDKWSSVNRFSDFGDSSCIP